MGFLSNLFGGNKKNEPENNSASAFEVRETIRSMRKNEELTPVGAAYYSHALLNPNKTDVEFYYADLDKFGKYNFRENCQETICALTPLMTDKEFNRIEFRNAYYDEPVMPEMTFKAKEIAIVDCLYSAQDCNLLAQTIANSLPESLVLNEVSPVKTTKGKETFPLIDGICANDEVIGNLKSLTISDCQIDDHYFEKLAKDVLPKAQNLKKLDLSDNYARSNGIVAVIDALPKEIEEISLARLFLDEDALSALETKLPQLTKLKSVNFKYNMMDDAALKKIMDVLPPSVEELKVSDNRIKKDGLDFALDIMSQSGCRIHKTDIADQLFMREQGYQQKFDDVCAVNRQNALEGVEYNKAYKPIQTPQEKLEAATPQEAIGLMHEAIKANLFDQTMDKMKAGNVKFKPEDFQAKNGRGETVLTVCEKLQLVPKIMEPDFYKNAKDFQDMYNALSTRGKAQMDGKEGRPNFLKLKTQMMATAIRQSVGNNQR